MDNVVKGLPEGVQHLPAATWKCIRPAHPGTCIARLTQCISKTQDASKAKNQYLQIGPGIATDVPFMGIVARFHGQDDLSEL